MNFLSTEISLKILSYLPEENLVNTRAIDKYWNFVSNILIKKFFNQNAPFNFESNEPKKLIEFSKEEKIVLIKASGNLVCLVYAKSVREDGCYMAEMRRYTKNNEFEKLFQELTPEKIISIDVAKNKKQVLLQLENGKIILKSKKITEYGNKLDGSKVNGNACILNEKILCNGYNYFYENSTIDSYQMIPLHPSLYVTYNKFLRHDHQTCFTNWVNETNELGFHFAFWKLSTKIKMFHHSFTNELIKGFYIDAKEKSYQTCAINLRDFQVMENVFFLQMQNTLVKKLGNSQKTLLENVNSFALDKSTKQLSVIHTTGEAAIYQLPQDQLLKADQVEKRHIKFLQKMCLRDIGNTFLSNPEIAMQRFNDLPQNVKEVTFGCMYDLIKPWLILNNNDYFPVGEDAFRNENGIIVDDKYRYQAVMDTEEKLCN